MPARVVLALLLAAPVANALTLSHSGYLLDALDAGVDAPALPMSFSLWSAPSGGTQYWPASGVATCTIEVRAGYYATELGGTCGTGLTAAMLPAPGSPLYLQVDVDAVPLLPRTSLSPALAASTVTPGAIGTTELAARAVTPAKLSSGAASAGTALVADGTGGAAFAPVAWGSISGTPATFPSAAHAHPISEVTSLQTALDGKAPTSHAHTVADVTSLQGALDAKASVTHAHAIADVTNLQAALDAKAAVNHAHTIANVTGLQAALDAKAATTHGHAIADVTGLQAALDAKASGGTRQVLALSVEGLDDASRAAAAGYVGIPDLDLSFTLDGTSVVLTEFDFTVNPSTAGAWAAFKFEVDGVAETRATHVQPSAANEEAHVHLFRLDQLTAGPHRIRALWGEGAGTIVNNAGNTSYSPSLWSRRLSVLGIPIERGVKFGYVEGTNDACRTGTYPTPGWVDVPNLATNVVVTEASTVLSLADLNVVGANNDWTNLRMVLDGAADPTNVALQPIGAANEDTHGSLFRIDSVAAGTHPVSLQWGYGAGNVCNTASGPGAQIWTRRLGWLAIPNASGVRSAYRNPVTNISHAAGTGYVDMPGVRAEVSIPTNSVVWTKLAFSFDPQVAGGWVGLRLNVDGRSDARASHANPSSGSEDSEVSIHRVDWLTGGVHVFKAEWGDGNGTPYSDGTGTYWTHRLGVLAIPVQ